MIKRNPHSKTLAVGNKTISRYYFHDGEKQLNFKSFQSPEHHFDTHSADVVGIDIEVRNARKIDFAKKDHFIVKFSDREKGYYESGYALYIYTPNVLDLEPKINWSNDFETNTTELVHTGIKVRVRDSMWVENYATWVLGHSHKTIQKPLGNTVKRISSQLEQVLGERISELTLKNLISKNKITLTDDQIVINL